MADLSTKFAGLELANPVVVSSSGLTDSVEKIQKLEEAGAGAVVLKSLFEEQILVEAEVMSGSSNYPEADDYIKHYTRTNKVDEYLNLIEGAASASKIPVIASINCVSDSEWFDFAKKIEEAGADALELNVYFLSSGKDTGSQNYEKLYLDIAENVKSRVEIPVIMKLGQNFTNLVNLVDLLYHRGIDGVVLFNRFYSPDINIKELRMTSSEVFSSPSDLRYSLRWVAIVSSLVDQVDIAASTGIHDGTGVIKQLLAGAQAVQVCSAIYKNGPSHIQKMLDELGNWMDEKKFENLAAFRGKMNYKSIQDPEIYERSQFMKYFSSHH
ncbi:dihydroorotate dehydrogenase-like protein [Bacteroidota bacterium]